MKSLTFLFLSALLSSPAFAKELSTSLEINLTAAAVYDSMMTTHHDGGSAECRPDQGGGRAETFEPKQKTIESKSGNGMFSDSGSANYEMQGAIYNGGTYTPRVLNLRFDFDTVSDGDPYGMRKTHVVFEDSIKPSTSLDTHFHCGHSFEDAILSRSLLKGTMVFRYKVPDGIWFIKSNMRKSEKILNRVTESYKGALHVSVVSDGQLITVAPNSTLELVVDFNKASAGEKFEGEMEWLVQPIIENTLPSSSYSVLGRGGIQIKEWSTKVAETSNVDLRTTFKILDKPMSAAERSIAILSRLSASKQTREQIIKDNRTDSIARMINDDLRDYVDFDRAQLFDHQGAAWEVKAAASIANYLLAYHVASQAVNVCERIPFETADPNRTRSVKAVNLIWYYLKGVSDRIKYYNFENYRAIFGEIKRLETAGYTYGQVMRDESRRTKLMKAYLVLKNTMDLSKMPFTSAYTDVLVVSKKIGSLGPSDQMTQSILDNLKNLASLEKPFVTETMQRFLKFRENNEEKIVISDLVDRLGKIIDGQKQISSDLETKVRFLSFDTKNVEGVRGLVEILITRNLSLMTNILPEVEFESVRRALVQYQGFDAVSGKALSCGL